MNTHCIPIQPAKASATNSPFPLNQWYVAGFSSELTDKPIARTFLNHKVVLFRTGEGQVAALEDRCCHRHWPGPDPGRAGQGAKGLGALR